MKHNEQQLTTEDTMNSEFFEYFNSHPKQCPCPTCDIAHMLRSLDHAVSENLKQLHFNKAYAKRIIDEGYDSSRPYVKEKNIPKEFLFLQSLSTLFAIMKEIDALSFKIQNHLHKVEYGTVYKIEQVNKHINNRIHWILNKKLNNTRCSPKFCICTDEKPCKNPKRSFPYLSPPK